jgi:hypothetical protein
MTNALTNKTEVVANAGSDAIAGLIGYCDTYSYSILVAAAAFLLLGLVFVAVAAVHEARKSAAEARKAEAEAAKAEAEAKAAQGGQEIATTIALPAVVTAVKGLAAALGDAKAWVAMILIGLLLSWMAGNAPNLCKSGFVLTGAEENKSGDDARDDPAGNGAASGLGNDADPADGNGADPEPGTGNSGSASETEERRR